MDGNAIQAVNVGIRLLYDELMKDPMAIETVFISLITFDSEVKQLIPLTPITQFTPPQLKAYGATSLGGALKMLNDKLDTEIIKNSPERKGDYKPLVFLMTDGRPTDTWEPAANALRNRPKQKVATIIALGCGSGVDQNILQRTADVVLLMQNVTPDQITQFFKWVSQSVSTASKSAQMAAGDQEAVAELSAPPEGIKIII
jgi:uncharacterized protein YegL